MRNTVTPISPRRSANDVYTRLKLEDFISDRSSNKTASEDGIFITREIERLLSAGRFQLAYDMYIETTEDDAPEDFREFIARHIDDEFVASEI